MKKVSVLIVTYNHEKFIAQAIDGVLAQKVNFEYEILIGEDDSTDKTREIVKEYKRRYPNKIQLFLNNRKNVIYINGQPTGRWNFINLLKHAEGKYIALCEGDDYWIKPDKLQRQVDFLENNPGFVLCCHDYFVKYEGYNITDHRNKKPLPKISDLPYLLKYHHIATCSVVFRNGLIKDFPSWYYKSVSADWPLYIMLAQYGKVYCIKGVMSVHRIHRGGIHRNNVDWDTKKWINVHKNNIFVYEELKYFLNGKYRNLINEQLFSRSFQVLIVCFKNMYYSDFLKYAFKFLRYKLELLLKP